MKIFKRIALRLLVGIVGLLLLLSVVFYFFSDRIKNAALSQLNKQLAVPVGVKNIEVDIWTNFPNASLTFEGILILGSKNGMSNDTLLQAGRLSLQLDPIGLMKGEYKVKGLSLQHARVHILIDSLGKTNYQILKIDEKTKGPDIDQEVLSFQLDDIALLDVNFQYRSAQNEILLSTYIKEGKASGQFQGESGSIRVDLDNGKTMLSNKSVAYFKRPEMGLKGSFNYSPQAYTFKEVALSLGNKASFKVDGFLKPKSGGFDTDVKIDAKQTDIQTILSLLPSNVQKSLNDYHSQGNVWFRSRLLGKIDGSYLPGIEVDFGFKNASIKHQTLPKPLTGVFLQGHYKQVAGVNKSTTGILSLKDIRGKLGKNDFQGALELKNMVDPFINYNVAGTIELKDLLAFAPIPNLSNGTGIITIDMAGSGKLNTPSTLIGDGTCILQEVNFLYGKSSFNALNGKALLQKKLLTIDLLSGKLQSNPFNVEGTITNLFPYLLSPNQDLSLLAKVSLTNANLEHWIELGNVSSTNGNKVKTSTVGPSPNGLHLPQNITTSLDVKAQGFTYGKMQATSLSASLHMENGDARVSNLNISTLGGKVSGNLLVHPFADGSFKVTSSFELKNIDVKNTFIMCNEFGQDYLTSNNIKGTLTCRSGTLSSLWKPDYTVDYKTLQAKTDIEISNGYLSGFNPLTQIGKYIHSKSLDNLQFATLKNKIEVKDGKIFIPKMDIQSNALNLTAGGWHGFDNTINYKLVINGSQLYFGKRTDYEDEFGTVEVTKNGGLTFHLQLSGNADNPKISYDKQAKGEDVRQSIRSEGQSIRDVFRGNNTNPRDTTKPKKPKDNLNQRGQETEIEW